jgi:hypothetical protein
MFSVFIQSRRAHAPEFPPRQHGFQQIGRVHGAFRGPGPHQRVEFINKQNDRPLGVDDFFQHGFQSIFKFPPILGPGDERPQIQRQHPFGFEALRHIAGNDALGQPLRNSGFPHAGFPDQDRIVFGSTGQHLDHAADFLIATDHRVQFSPRAASVKSRAYFSKAWYLASGFSSVTRWDPRSSVRIWSAVPARAPGRGARRPGSPGKPKMARR